MTFFFDIETGGFDSNRSPVASISYGTGSVISSYSYPSSGSLYSPWAVKNVWNPIKGEELVSERETLLKFLKEVEGREKGSTIAGWNIGYSPVGQAKGVQGFDIPFLISRSEKFGLRGRFESAFRRLKIRDIGQEQAWKMATAVHARPDLVEESLFAQIDSYMKVGRAWAREKGVDETSEGGIQRISRYMGTSGMRVAGWKQELIHGLLFGEGYDAHKSADDVRAMMRIFNSKQGISGEHISDWASRALMNKLVSGARSQPRAEEAIEGRFEKLLQTATDWGGEKFKGEFLEELGTKDLGRIKKGLGAPVERLVKVPGSRAGLAIAAAGTLLAGGLLFSADDDVHNTIEGLPHGGEAEKLRRALTDFGSGYQGVSQTTAENDPTLVSRALGFAKGFNQALFLGTAALTGFDRFGKYGALAGLALGGLGAYGAEKASFEDADGDLRKTMWNVGIQGILSSASSSMLASSTMKGTLFGGMIEKHLPSVRDQYSRAVELGIPREQLEAGGVGSLQSLIYGSIARKISPKPLKNVAENLASAAGGSPFLLKKVMEHGDIRSIPAGEYFSANLIDIATGTAAGLIPGAAAGVGVWALQSGDDLLQEDPEVRSRVGAKRRFKFFTDALEVYGEKVGTGHKRLEIPKELLGREEIEGALGFEAVTVAIPEAGQTSFASYRSQDSLHHLHEHGQSWTFHTDRHASATMELKKFQREQKDAGLFEELDVLASGIPHIFEEGLPGAFYYVQGILTGGDDMLERIRDEVSPRYYESLDLLRKGKATKAEAYLRIPGGDDAYNTIEGLPHGGLAEKQRRALTDFGSGYQGQEESPLGVEHFASMGVGALLFDHLVFPSIKVDKKKYPRLASLREGGKSGFKMLSGLSKESTDSFWGRALWGDMNPVSGPHELENFKGLTYIQSGEYSRLPKGPTYANLGNWGIGRDKVDTYRHLMERNVSDLHADTLFVEDFYDQSRLSKKGEEFVSKHGGIDNLILKRRDTARGVGVWMDTSNLPAEIREEMLKNPRGFLLQEKLDLAEEFRVVTVGDKTVHSSYRFGDKNVQSLSKKLGYEVMKDASDKTKFRKSPLEVIQPIVDREVKSSLEAFAEKASRELPYEIGAFDIGLTKAGQFKIIEAQRSFGNISNPMVSGRIRKIITGATGRTAPVMALGAATGLLASLLFSGADDEYNTIEGLPHGGEGEKKRKELTDFGSGWIRKAISLNLSPEKIGKAASKLGSGSTGSTPAAYAELLTGKLKSDPESAISFFRKTQGVTVEGKHWSFGKKIAKGGFGETWNVHETAGAHRQGVLKRLHTPEADPFRPDGDGLVLTPGLASNLRSAANRGDLDEVGAISDYANSYMSQIRKEIGGGTSIQYEAEIQKRARKQFGDMVPEVYGVEKSAFIQEFAGVSVKGNLKAETSALNFMEKNWAEWFSPGHTGITHYDPHLGNVVRKGGRMRAIDWGLGAETKGGPSGMNRDYFSGEALDDYLSAHRKSIAEKVKNPEAYATTIRDKVPDTLLDSPSMRMKLAAAHKKSVRLKTRLERKGAKGSRSFSNKTPYFGG